MEEKDYPQLKMWQVLNLVLPSDTNKERFEFTDYFARVGNKLANRVLPEATKEHANPED